MILDTLVIVRNALLTVLPDRVFLPHDDMPDDDDPLIRIDPLGHSDRIRYGSIDILTTVQVTCYALQLTHTLDLSARTRTVLRSQKLIPSGGRYVLDAPFHGWAADYRRQ